MLDRKGDWDWSDDGEHEPSERVAVLESSGAWWAVYRGSADDDARRCDSKDAAIGVAQAWGESVGLAVSVSEAQS
ncbi:MAG TPA: hypothetical protein VGI39_04915 [Polyangiaceae bacterium]|jgi:hypothetical protein